MAGLIDVAMITESVHIQGEDFAVHGLSFAALARLVSRFPKLAGLIQGGALDFASLSVLGPEFLAAFLAAGLDHNWSPEVEKVVAQLPIDDQLQIFAAILKVSMPRGTGPFVETITSIVKLLGLSNPDSSGGNLNPSSTQQPQSSA